MDSNPQILNTNNTNNINNTSGSILTNSKSLYQLDTMSNMLLPLPVKPKFIKTFNDLMTNCNHSIFNYLTLQEVSLLRGVNKLFLNVINDYYEIRLKIEINEITNFQNENEENTTLYMQNIDSQIPISNNNWLEFDLKKVTKDMEILDKNTIIQLKSIKKLTKFSENIYAPFCIIFGYKLSNYKVKANGWKKTADTILNDPNIMQKIKQLDYENFSDNDILKAFLYLNSDDLLISKIKRYSLPFVNLIKWCQAVVSYHILIHPYTFRNKTSQIEIGSEVHKYVLFMDKIISKFYKFKRFLFKLGLVQIPLGDYVFNLQHNKIIPKENVDLSKIINVDMIANILSYLPLEDSYKFINVNQFGVNCFKQSLNNNCYRIIKEIILFKLQSYDKLFPAIPILYENNIFGKYFLMLDDILNSTLDVNQFGTNYIPFLSKGQLNEIRHLKIDNQYINTVCKIFCILFNLKVEKKANKRGELVPLYTKAIKSLAVKGILPKMMRYFDKIELNKKQLQVLMNEVINLYGKNKIQDIKKINKGIYQVLLWELCLFEYLKEFNPFLFINVDIFQKNLENNNWDDIQMMNYYLEMINFLKYNLKFKYHFQSLVFTNMPEVPCYEFIPMVTTLLQELNNEKINISPLLDNSNNDKVKTANIYFDNKDYIPISAKPALYERIIEEIFSINEKLFLNTISNENLINKSFYNNYTFNNENKANINVSESNNLNNNNLGIIREENSSAANIGDNQILNKYLQNKNNINHNLNNNLNGINELQNGGEDSMNNNTDNQMNNNLYNMNNFDIISSINFQKKNKNILQDNNYTSFNDIHDNIIIKNILLYLDIKSVSPFSLVNKKCNRCYKINMFLRLLILDNHKQIFENENEEYIKSINNKRNNFFTDYEIPPPNKEHALQLMSQLKNKDILEIKNIYRKYNKHNEILIAPFVYLLGEKPQKKYNINGQKKLNFFNPAQKLLNNRKINKKISEMNLDTIPSNVFREIEKLLKNEAFNYNKMKGYSPCLYNLICWEMGVLEYHRAVRYFCLNYYDYKILSKEEIVFCSQLDNINIMFNKLKYYNYKFGKEYEKNANDIMKEINSMVKDVDENENQNENEEMEQYESNNENGTENEEKIINENINNNINDNNDANILDINKINNSEHIDTNNIEQNNIEEKENDIEQNNTEPKNTEENNMEDKNVEINELKDSIELNNDENNKNKKKNKKNKNKKKEKLSEEEIKEKCEVENFINDIMDINNNETDNKDQINLTENKDENVNKEEENDINNQTDNIIGEQLINNKDDNFINNDNSQKEEEFNNNFQESINKSEEKNINDKLNENNDFEIEASLGDDKKENLDRNNESNNYNSNENNNLIDSINEKEQKEE